MTRGQKILLAVTITFFAVINTMALWEHYLGFYSFFLFIMLMGVYCILFVYMLVELARYFKTKNKSGLVLSGIIALVLVTSFLLPRGLINFERFEGEDYLVAGREGSANCFTMLKLKKDGRFTERVSCFGVSKTMGTYALKGDTVFFETEQLTRNYNEYYNFAVIQKDSINWLCPHGTLLLYENYNDTTPNFLGIDVTTLSP